VPTSRTCSSPVRPRAETIMAISEGWVVTCPWGSGTGVSRYADATSSAGTNSARGMLRTASRRRASVTPTAWAARTRSSGVPSWAIGPWGRGGGAGGPGRGAFQEPHSVIALSARRRLVAHVLGAVLAVLGTVPESGLRFRPALGRGDQNV